MAAFMPKQLLAIFTARPSPNYLPENKKPCYNKRSRRMQGVSSIQDLLKVILKKYFFGFIFTLLDLWTFYRLSHPIWTFLLFNFHTNEN